MNENEVFLKSIGNNIRKLRNDRNISQQALADMSNIAKSTIQRIESGKLNPSIIMLNNISKAFSISLCEIVEF
jgi:transcriptional regulator with XRE-family HTH domain